MKKFLQKFRYGEKGFTLIELLVVIAILGILAAVAVPNISNFIGKGKTEASETETNLVQTAVLAAMADAQSADVSGGSDTANTENFGNTDHGASGNYTATGCAVDTGYNVEDYIMSGAADIAGSYWITTGGNVTLIYYPDVLE